MADDGLPSSYKFAPAPRTGASPAPAPSASLPSGYKPPAAPAAGPPPLVVNPPTPAPAPPPSQNDGGWLHWLATKGLGQDYQRSLGKGVTLGFGELITGGIMGGGEGAGAGEA